MLDNKNGKIKEKFEKTAKVWKRIKEIKNEFNESTKKLKELETIDELEFQINKLKYEIQHIVGKNVSYNKGLGVYANLKSFINHKFDLSKQEGKTFTKSLTTWLYNKNNKKTRIILNPMSIIFLAKKEILAWGKAFDYAVKEVNKKENIKKNEENKNKREQLYKESQRNRKIKVLSKEEEDKELAELLKDS